MSTKYQPDYHFEKISPALKDAKSVFKGSRFEVRQLKNREAIIHPGAVIILPIMDDKNIILIKNERFVVGETLWELPAGTLEPKEHPQATAERELLEETGYSSKDIEYLTSFYTSPGICNERMYAYVAKKLTFIGQKLDPNEKITTEIVSWSQALQMIKDGAIHDGKTIATLLFYQNFFRSFA